MDDSDAEIAANIQDLCLRHESVPAFLEAMRKIPQQKKSLVGRIFVSLCAKTFMGRKYRLFAEAMLNGETGHVLDVNFTSPGGASGLHFAAKNHDFELIALLLSHGARTDLRGLRPRMWNHGEDVCYVNCEGKIPLELAYFIFPPFILVKPSYWTSNSGELFGIFLAHVATEFVRKSFELLTKNTEKIGKVVYHCVKEASPEILGLLLLSDREKVLSSNVLENSDGFSHKQRVMTVQEAILAEIASANEDRSKLTGCARRSLLYRKLESKEQRLSFCLKLLEVFDKAAGALNALLVSNNGQKVGVRQVASLLKECGCDLSYDDSTHPGLTLDDLDDLKNVSQLLNNGVEVGNPAAWLHFMFQDASRCSFMYPLEAEDEYHTECSKKYDRFISDATIVRDAGKHIFHHAFYGTGQAKSTFIKFMKTIPVHKMTLVNNILIYVLCCAYESGRERFFPIYMSCISSLLSGETEHNVDVNFVGSIGSTALHVAASALNKESVEMLLLHGASADIRIEKPRDDDVYDSMPFVQNSKAFGMLPLELALPLNFPYDFEAADWTSYSGLVLATLMEEFEPKADEIEVIGLLSSHTKETRQVAEGCIREGEVVALVALVLGLLGAYKKAVSFPVENGMGPSEGFMKISEYTLLEIVNVTEKSLRKNGKGGKHSQVKDIEIKKNKLIFVLYMLEVIEAARKNGKVAVKDVSRFLKSKNFSSEKCMRDTKRKLQKFQDSLSESQVSQNPATEEEEASKRIKLLKKKIRVARAQQKDKVAQLESLMEELQLLKDKKAETDEEEEEEEEEDI